MENHNGARPGNAAADTGDSHTLGCNLSGDPERLASFMHEVGKLRRLYMDGTLFANPSWDILLTLYLGHRQARPVSLAMLSAANQIPAAECETVLATLIERGFAWQTEDTPSRAEISDLGVQRLDAFLRSVARH